MDTIPMCSTAVSKVLIPLLVHGPPALVAADDDDSTVPAASALRLGVLLMGVIPVGLLAAGIIIWIRRKKR